MELGGLPALTLALLLCGAFFAGLVDAIVGGGGLIQIPLLFSALPGVAPAALFGTNKISSVFGTTIATLQYARRVSIPWAPVLPAALAAFAFSFLGAVSVAYFPTYLLRPLILVLLIAVAIYTVVRKDFGRREQARVQGSSERWLALGCGALLGFYDGFFGPGTGSFLIFVFVRFFGLDFLRASAAAKVVNVGTNVAALLYFGAAGHLLFALGFGMAVLNVCGALVGSRLALRHGADFVRRAFLLVVSVLILKFAYDTVVATG